MCITNTKSWTCYILANTGLLHPRLPLYSYRRPYYFECYLTLRYLLRQHTYSSKLHIKSTITKREDIPCMLNQQLQVVQKIFFILWDCSFLLWDLLHWPCNFSWAPCKCPQCQSQHIGESPVWEPPHWEWWYGYWFLQIGEFLLVRYVCCQWQSVKTIVWQLIPMHAFVLFFNEGLRVRLAVSVGLRQSWSSCILYSLNELTVTFSQTE